MDDKRIIELFFCRDEQALKETQIKYGRLCFKLAHSILGNREDAQECENDTYLALWQRIPPARPENLTAFICRIARNISLKRLEYNSAEKRSAALVSWSELEEAIPDSSFENEMEDARIGELINSFLHAEKEDARNVFIRRYYFGDDILEIAENFAFSESKVKSMLFYTRNKLKKYLIEKGVCL